MPVRSRIMLCAVTLLTAVSMLFTLVVVAAWVESEHAWDRVFMVRRTNRPFFSAWFSVELSVSAGEVQVIYKGSRVVPHDPWSAFAPAGTKVPNGMEWMRVHRIGPNSLLAVIPSSAPGLCQRIGLSWHHQSREDFFRQQNLLMNSWDTAFMAPFWMIASLCAGL